MKLLLAALTVVLAGATVAPAQTCGTRQSQRTGWHPGKLIETIRENRQTKQYSIAPTCNQGTTPSSYQPIPVGPGDDGWDVGPPTVPQTAVKPAQKAVKYTYQQVCEIDPRTGRKTCRGYQLVPTLVDE